MSFITITKSPRSHSLALDSHEHKATVSTVHAPIIVRFTSSRREAGGNEDDQVLHKS